MVRLTLAALLYRFISCGQFSKVQVIYFLPDPGALNSGMHTFPETNAGCTMVYHTTLHFEMGFETLDLKLCELKL